MCSLIASYKRTTSSVYFVQLHILKQANPSQNIVANTHTYRLNILTGPPLATRQLFILELSLKA